MIEVIRRVSAVGAAAAVISLALASASAAQTSAPGAFHQARRLGGPTALYSHPLRAPAGLKQMVESRGMAEDLRTVLRDSGIPETSDAVIGMFRSAATSVRGGYCDDATPADGVIVECDVRPGNTFLWMALRPNVARGDRKPGRLDSVRWAGDKPFRAYLFRVTNDYKVYTFVVPMVCGNMSLMSVADVPAEPVMVSVDRVCDPATGNLRATVRARSRDLERVQMVTLSINGQPAGEMTRSSWTVTATRSGDYTFGAVDLKGRTYAVAERTLRVDACAPPPPPMPVAKKVVGPTCSVTMSVAHVRNVHEISVNATHSTTGTASLAPSVTVELRDGAGVVVAARAALDNSLARTITVRRSGTYRAAVTVTTPQPFEEGAFRYEGTATCEDSVTIEEPPSGVAIFFDVLAGKDRRVRPIEGTSLDFAQCSPLLGVKIGVAKRFQNDWELAGAAGVAISLVTSSKKVKESEVFIDAEVNKYLSGGAFIGTGLSLWDLTRRDTLTPAWLLHFGVPLWKGQRHTLFFMGEGRLFFDHLKDFKNNYLLWAGLRLRFGR